jgi:hypothetical protein
VDGRLGGAREVDLHVPASVDLADCVGPGRESHAGAVVERDLAVCARRQACLPLLRYGDVFTTTLDGRGFAEGTARRERPHDAPHGGARSLMHGMGVDVEDARAVPEPDEGAGDRGVVVEEDLAAQDEAAIGGGGAQVSARRGGVVEAATFLRTNHAVWHLYLRGGTEGAHEERHDVDHPNQTPECVRVAAFHGSPLCGLAAPSPLSLTYGQQMSVGGVAPSSPRRDARLSPTFRASESA